MDRRDYLKMCLAGGAGLVAAGRPGSSRAGDLLLKDLTELDRLEYFERDGEGRLWLRKEAADRVIDFHTHIALSFLFGPRLDLDSEGGELKPYFPIEGNPVDLNVYSGSSFTEENDKINTKENLKQGFTHRGYAGTHTPKNLLKQMEENRVTRAVILAIDNPFLGAASRNSRTYLEAARQYPRLIPFVSVHPNDALMERRVRQFKREGAVGMKLHPQMQFIRPNHPNCMKLTKICGELNMPCLFHSGASDVSPEFQQDYPRIDHFWEPVSAQPGTTFILAHGGIHFYKDLIELARAHKNVYIELSGQPPGPIQEMIEAGLEDRMLFGSDFPFYIIAFPLAKVLIATEGKPELRKKILYQNAEKLLDRFGA